MKCPQGFYIIILFIIITLKYPPITLSDPTGLKYVMEAFINLYSSFILHQSRFVNSKNNDKR